MAYRAEIVARARQRMESARADLQTLQRQRLEEVYKTLPRIRQIDQELRRSMALAAQAAFAGGGDQSPMEQVRKANQALQRERQALLETRFPADYLMEEALCPYCGGSGYVGSTMCSCLKELCSQEQRRELALLTCGEGRFEEFRLDYYPQATDPKFGVSPRLLMEKNYQVCLKYAENFGPASGNLLFVGGTGLGKTFLSACIARRVIDGGWSVMYEPASRLFAKLEKNRFNPDEESGAAVAQMESCDLLILDDLGTELPGAFVTASLYSLVNDRLLAGKPMVISTNLTVEELGRRYTPQIASRLQGSFRRLTFLGQDIRVLKNRG